MPHRRGLDDQGRGIDGVLDRARRTAAIHTELGLTGMFIGCGMSKEAVRVAQRPACGYAFDQTRLDRVVESLSEVAEARCAEGVRPGLHPHVGTWVETDFETRYVLDNVDAALLAFGPDTGHLASVLDVLGQEFEGWLVAEVDRPNLPTAQASIAACARWIQTNHRSERQRQRPTDVSGLSQRSCW